MWQFCLQGTLQRLQMSLVLTWRVLLAFGVQRPGVLLLSAPTSSLPHNPQ